MAHPALISDHGRNTSSNLVRKAHPALTSDHERNQSSHLCQKGSALTFDHARNQSSIYVKRALHLHLTMRGTNPACQKGSALTYDHVRNQSSMLEGLCTYIWSCGMNTSRSHIRMALSPRLSIPGNWPGASILPENGLQHLYLIMWEHIPQSNQNGFTLIMW